ncbi:MAG: nucleotide exchange factor GrpE [Desulfobacteraceae bacterium]|nr:nucleotide exchange factor GrpE [Desulfobacteraceae bacterium]
MADKDEPINKIKSEEPPKEKNETQKSKKEKKKTSSKKESPEKGKSEVDALKEELAAEKDRVLRLSAEFENYKKRSSKEMSDFKKFANESLFKQLLTVVDNIERAIGSAKDGEPEVATLLAGVEMTHKEILKFLTNFNVKPVEAQGKAFDPAFHQAVTQQESEDHPENTVVAELQKGYLFHDRLIRPSMVVVSKALTEKETENK